MGNCQAVDAAALVIQHPSGRIERMYWSITANEVMNMNPGHYVSLIIPIPIHHNHQEQQDLHECNINDTNNDKNDKVRVKLLRSTDTLVLGRAYRLITSQEVMKVLRAKRYAKMKKKNRELPHSTDELENRSSSGCEAEASSSSSDNINQVSRDARHRQRSRSANLTRARSKSWRPSLQSISEAGSL